METRRLRRLLLTQNMPSAMMSELCTTQALEPRRPRASPQLRRAAEQITALVNAWSDGLAQAIAAPNLFLDVTLAQRRMTMEALHAEVGACRSGAPTLDHALRGELRLTCERGALSAAVDLAPTKPPRLQRANIERAGEPPVQGNPLRRPK
jgi:hypothetical protein